VPEPPPVSEEVERAATALATKVWTSGARPRDQLFAGINPLMVDEYLAHAVSMHWVIIDGDRIAPGKVSPVPMTALPSVACHK
jgi:hypothetical protein